MEKRRFGGQTVSFGRAYLALSLCKHVEATRRACPEEETCPLTYDTPYPRPAAIEPPHDPYILWMVQVKRHHPGSDDIGWCRALSLIADQG